nr:MAG TPA: hypothetical protein [Caudoviricetes sp.]
MWDMQIHQKNHHKAILLIKQKELFDKFSYLF